MFTSTLHKRFKKLNIHPLFRKNYKIMIYPGDCLDLLRQIPDESIQLIATSPPIPYRPSLVYGDESIQLITTSPPCNIKKEYEHKLKPDTDLEQQSQVIKECIQILSKKQTDLVQDRAVVDPK